MPTVEELQAQVDALTQEKEAIQPQLVAAVAMRKEYEGFKDTYAKLSNELDAAKKQVREWAPLAEQVKTFTEKEKGWTEKLSTSEKKQSAILTKHLVEGYGVDAHTLENKTIDQLEAILQALPTHATVKPNSAAGQGLSGGGQAPEQPMTAYEAAKKDLEKLGVKV